MRLLKCQPIHCKITLALHAVQVTPQTSDKNPQNNVQHTYRRLSLYRYIYYKQLIITYIYIMHNNNPSREVAYSIKVQLICLFMDTDI